MSLTKFCKQYKDAGFKLTHIPSKSKGPVHKGWQKNPTKYKKLLKLSNINIGILHGQSGTCCFDIDDIKKCCKKFTFLKKLINGQDGCRWTSGKPNRIKIMFKLPVELKDMGSITIPMNCGQIRSGKGIQDVLPPSIHPEGDGKWVYSWVDGYSLEDCGVPDMPNWLLQKLLVEAETKSKSSHGSAADAVDSRYPFITVYNKWFMQQQTNILDEVLNHCDGAYIQSGFTALKRVGSSNRLAAAVYQDVDGIDRIYNFSDTEGKGLLPHGLCDPYTVLSWRKGFNEARKWVCTHKEMADLVTLAEDTKIVGKKGDIGTNDTEVSKLLLDGILFDDDNKKQPYLDMSKMLPRDNNGKLNGFGRLVKSMVYHQEGVYNPAMAFWYSLCLADYLIGGGYLPYMGNSTEPIYCFTSGVSGDGKTVTMKSGDLHTAHFRKGFKAHDNLKPKQVIKNVATSQGLEDKITTEMSDGCDILFTQDEYGLKENGTMDMQGRNMRAMILDLKTLGRSSVVEPRLLAKSFDKGKEMAGGREPKTCVHFTYFTTSTDTTLKGIIGDTEVGQGYVQRFIGGSSRTPYYTSRVDKFGTIAPKEGFKQDKKLLKLLDKIVSISGKSLGKSGKNRVIGKKVKRVKIDDNAMDYINQLLNICIKSGDPLVSKLVENISPIAKIAAIFESPSKPVVTLEMVKWSHTICSSSILYFRWLMGNLRHEIGGNKDMAAESKILSYMGRNCVGSENSKSRMSILSGSGVKRIMAAKGYGTVWDALVTHGQVRSFEKENLSGQMKKTYFVED